MSPHPHFLIYSHSHTRNLKIALPIGIQRLKTENFPGFTPTILKMQIFFFLYQQKLGELGLKAMRSRDPSAPCYLGERQPLLFWKSQMPSQTRVREHNEH